MIRKYLTDALAPIRRASNDLDNLILTLKSDLSDLKRQVARLAQSAPSVMMIAFGTSDEEKPSFIIYSGPLIHVRESARLELKPQRLMKNVTILVICDIEQVSVRSVIVANIPIATGPTFGFVDFIYPGIDCVAYVEAR